MKFLHLTLASAAAAEVSVQLSLLLRVTEIQGSLVFNFKYYEVVYQYYERANVGRFNPYPANVENRVSS